MRFETENPWIAGPIIFGGVVILVAAAVVGVMLDLTAYVLGLASGVIFGIVKVRRL